MIVAAVKNWRRSTDLARKASIQLATATFAVWIADPDRMRLQLKAKQSSWQVVGAGAASRGHGKVGPKAAWLNAAASAAAAAVGAGLADDDLAAEARSEVNVSVFVSDLCAQIEALVRLKASTFRRPFSTAHHGLLQQTLHMPIDSIPGCGSLHPSQDDWLRMHASVAR